MLKWRKILWNYLVFKKFHKFEKKTPPDWRFPSNIKYGQVNTGKKDHFPMNRRLNFLEMMVDTTFDDMIRHLLFLQ